MFLRKLRKVFVDLADSLIVAFLSQRIGQDLLKSLILILSSVILTGLNIYQKIVTFAGCGALVPITGFAE